MQTHAAQPNQWIGYVISTVIVVVVLAIRMRGMKRTRPLRLETLWVIPAIYAVFGAVMFVQFPPGRLGWLFSGLALLIGAALGWQRGKMMRITVDAETHKLNQQTSPAAMLFIVVLIGVRFAARDLLAGSGAYSLHLSTMLITDVLIALAVGLFATTRLEMYLRARRMLAAARAPATA